jgi:hypothetical protein
VYIALRFAHNQISRPIRASRPPLLKTFNAQSTKNFIGHGLCNSKQLALFAGSKIFKIIGSMVKDFKCELKAFVVLTLWKLKKRNLLGLIRNLSHIKFQFFPIPRIEPTFPKMIDRGWHREHSKQM